MKRGRGRGRGGSRGGTEVVYTDFSSAMVGKGGELLAKLAKADSYGFFLQPVNVVEVPGYLSIIKTPMDIGTCQKALEAGEYRSLVRSRCSDQTNAP